MVGIIKIAVGIVTYNGKFAIFCQFFLSLREMMMDIDEPWDGMGVPSGELT